MTDRVWEPLMDLYSSEQFYLACKSLTSFFVHPKSYADPFVVDRFYGITSLQSIHYFNGYADRDQWKMKTLVGNQDTLEEIYRR